MYRPGELFFVFGLMPQKGADVPEMCIGAEQRAGVSVYVKFIIQNLFHNMEYTEVRCTLWQDSK